MASSVRRYCYVHALLSYLTLSRGQTISTSTEVRKIDIPFCIHERRAHVPFRSPLFNGSTSQAICKGPLLRHSWMHLLVTITLVATCCYLVGSLKVVSSSRIHICKLLLDLGNVCYCIIQTHIDSTWTICCGQNLHLQPTFRPLHPRGVQP
jgi:hypothetical protein